MKITVEQVVGEVTTRRSLEFDGSLATPPSSVAPWLAWLEGGVDPPKEASVGSAYGPKYGTGLMGARGNP